MSLGRRIRQFFHGGDLEGSAPNPTVKQARGLRETAGPTTLTMGAVADGEFLKRSGTSIVSAAAGGSGLGDFVGPASAVDNAIVRFDGTTGKLGQGSTVTLDDTGAFTVPEMAAPGTPAAGKVAVYAKADGKLYIKDDAGTETDLTSTGAALTADAVSAPVYAADAGASDAYAITLSPVPSGYTTGTHYRFKANTANTGACTLNVNSLGAKTIKKVAGGITTDLADNDIRAGQFVDVVYDGTNMQMQSTLGNAAAAGSTNPTSTVIPYNSAGSFADSPLARTDANTIEHSNGTSSTSVRYNLYGVKNGTDFERFSWYYDSVNSKYVLSVNKGGTGTIRNIELEFDGTAFWRFHTGGTLFGLSNTDSVLAVGQGARTKLAVQFGNAGSSTGLFGEAGPYLNLATNASERLAVHDFGALTGSTGRFGWATTALGSGKTEDTAMSRAAASVVEINNGTAGGSGCLLLRGRTFANRPGTPITGMECTFTDSTTTTWGATITGGGSSIVRGWYNGTNWTVIGI